jgi:hypothetical protein
MSDGLSLVIDNTTLHRLLFALDPSSMPFPDAETANMLHLLECLVLAGTITVNGFESADSQNHSDRVLAWLDGSESKGLIEVSARSDRDTQIEVAGSVAREMHARGLLLPRPDLGDVDGINIALGRPRDVVELATSFWNEATSHIRRPASIRERAEEMVDRYRTDALFVHGLAQHDELIADIHAAYSRGAAPSDDRWRQLHVIFRSLFNQQFSERHQAYSYAPPPVRAAVLRAVYSRALERLNGAVSQVAVRLNAEVGNRALAEDLLEAASHPLPLLGLAFMLKAEAALPGAPFSERLAYAREEAAPLRMRLRELEALLRDDAARYVRELQGEAADLERVARAQLGIAKADGLGWDIDFGVTVDIETGSPSFDMTVSGGSPPGAVTRAMTRMSKRRRRMSVLSDGLARTVRFGSLQQAVRRAVA